MTKRIQPAIETKNSGVILKILVAIGGFIWFLCGFVGAWWLDDLHFQKIVRGPITLAKAFNEEPVSYPGP